MFQMNENLLIKAEQLIKSFLINSNIEDIYIGPKEERLAKSLQAAVNCYHRRNGDNTGLSELIKRLSQTELYINAKKEEKT